MGDDKRQNAFCPATHETLKQANPLLVNGLLEKQERKWVKCDDPRCGLAEVDIATRAEPKAQIFHPVFVARTSEVCCITPRPTACATTVSACQHSKFEKYPGLPVYHSAPVPAQGRFKYVSLRACQLQLRQE